MFHQEGEGAAEVEQTAGVLYALRLCEVKIMWERDFNRLGEREERVEVV